MSAFANAVCTALTAPLVEQHRGAGLEVSGGRAPVHAERGVLIDPVKVENAKRSDRHRQPIGPHPRGHSPAMQLYKLDFNWKNPDHDSAVEALTTPAVPGDLIAL